MQNLKKLIKIFTFNFNINLGTLSSYKDHLHVVKEKTSVISFKKNIFYNTDVYYTKFT